MNFKNIEIPKKSCFYFFFKRLFDIVFSFLAIIVLLPFFLIIFIIQVCCQGFPILYISERIGKDGKPFKMIKLRTMVKRADKMLDNVKSMNELNGPVFKIENDPRLTKIGHFWRKTSIDELMQLFNILFGQMSFVGPRPPLRQEVEQYDEFAKLRLMAKPGLTCIWQCSGRNRIGFDEWMKLDVEYLQKRSLWFDLKLIFKFGVL